MRVFKPASLRARSLCVIAGSATLAGLLAGCGSTTYGTGQAAEVAVFKELSGSFAILGGKKESNIEYGPRAPLVMPPQTDLRPPIEAAAEDPNWPQPPAEDEKVDYSSNEIRTSNDRLSQEEVDRQRALGALLPKPDSSERFSENDNDSLRLDPKTVSKQREEFQQALAAENTVGTERKYLTQPPDTVREPSPDAPTEFEDIEVRGQKSNLFGRFFK